MKYIKNLKNIRRTDVTQAGGKGANLGELIQAGFDVPAGFVVLASAFNKFLIEEKLAGKIQKILNRVKHENSITTAAAAEKIQTLILSAPFPLHLHEQILSDFHSLNSQYVAVRSSATAEDGADTSWAGELESYLNTTEANLLNNIKRCWASLFTPRAIYYRFENELQEKKVSVAVVVQSMIQSEISGICFTSHPITKDPNQLLIEAGLGLGEAIVGGLITPDNYIVNKKDLMIEGITISKQESLIIGAKAGTKVAKISKDKQELQKISGSEVIELAKTCIKIEKHFGYPCDIEWAHAGNKFHITQSRPITALQN